MEIKTHEAWGDWHATLFGFGAAMIPRMLAWIDEFKVCGYTPGELVAATRKIQLDPPEYSGDQYGAIHRHVQRERAEERLKFRSDLTTRNAGGKSTCEACGDSGWVIVPHAKFVQEWVDAARFVTATVLCRCYVASQIKTNWPQKRPATMTMDEYERQVPNWKELFAFQREIRRAKAKTAAVGEGTLGGAVKTILGRVTKQGATP